MSEAIEQLKANLPSHPPVDSLKPLEEDYTGLRILAVHAHPDDESSKGAGTASAYICLLYTSPSPRDRTRSRMPSSA